MNYRRLGVAAFSAALLAGGAATAGLAQQPPRPPMDAPRPSPEQRAERRAEHLRAALQLRPDQEGALRAYLEAGKRPPMDRERLRENRRELAGMTTPERLDRMAERMAERQARFERHAAATKRFYAALSPSQQKAFDALRGRGAGGPPRRG